MLDRDTIHFETIADGLAQRGFCVIDNFLQDDEIERILNLDGFSNNLLQFKKAGVGKSTNNQINESIRGDYIHWIDTKNAPASFIHYIDKLHALIAYLNQSLFLSLKDVELHMTTYPTGSFYKRHLDQFKTADHRKISVILYLNKDWVEVQGGQLRIYLDNESKDIFPVAGRLVCMRSDQIEHEVLPASRERLSITGWMLDQYVDLK